MTRCPKGQHDFPIEDDSGAYCEEHGVTLIWHGDPIAKDGLSHDNPSRRNRVSMPAERPPVGAVSYSRSTTGT